MPPRELKKHAMDVPHVTAVELPLHVCHTERAIAMLGGKQSISEAISSQNQSQIQQQQQQQQQQSQELPELALQAKQIQLYIQQQQQQQQQQQVGTHSVDENALELRLRDDPFHHPVQLLLSVKEKILLRVSVPKSVLPSDYYENPAKYTVRELVYHAKAQGAAHPKVAPVAVINKNYLFRAMADFQASTRHNAAIQEFNQWLAEAHTFEDVQAFFDRHHGFLEIPDYKDPAMFSNIDFHFPPPPLFSPIRFPYDYKYQKNPITSIVRDASGETRVVSSKDTLKIHSIILDYADPIPSAPKDTLVQQLRHLELADLTGQYLSQKLLQCVQWLQRLFGVKPVWTRKHLADLVPPDLKTCLKQALPFVLYTYRCGPWRFCNIKLGQAPKSDSSYWRYQCEYFRVPGLHLEEAVAKNGSPSQEARKVIPRTVPPGHPELEISEHLVFTGQRKPRVAAFQLGDITDADVLSYIETSLALGVFLKRTPDFQDGWVSRQCMETVRRVVKYKLNQLANERAVEAARIAKILSTDYTEDMEVDKSEKEEEDEEEMDTEVGAGAAGAEPERAALEDSVVARIARLEGTAAQHLSQLVGLIQQDAL